MSSSNRRSFLKQFGSTAALFSGTGSTAIALDEANFYCYLYFLAPQINEIIKWSLRNSPTRIERHLLLSKSNMLLPFASNLSYEKKNIVSWDPVTMKLLK